MIINRTAMLTTIAGKMASITGATYIPPTIKKAEGAIFEAYIYTCVIEAVDDLLKKIYCNTEFEEFTSPPGCVNQLVLRKQRCSISSAAKRYSHVVLKIGGSRYELHTDVPVSGVSKQRHELDVALIRAAACDKCRDDKKGNPDPSYQDIGLFVEAKCYSAATIEPNIGRAFLGLCHDLERRPASLLVTTATSAHIDGYLKYHGQNSGRPICFHPGLSHTVQSRNRFISVLSQSIEQTILKPSMSKLPTASHAEKRNKKQKTTAEALSSQGLRQPPLLSS